MRPREILPLHFISYLYPWVQKYAKRKNKPRKHACFSLLVDDSTLERPSCLGQELWYHCKLLLPSSPHPQSSHVSQGLSTWHVLFISSSSSLKSGPHHHQLRLLLMSLPLSGLCPAHLPRSVRSIQNTIMIMTLPCLKSCNALQKFGI